MSPHSTTLHCPCFTFSDTSFARISIATLSNADLCGPLHIASSICAFVQSLPVFVGQPSVAYFNSFPAASWFNVKPDGHIEPLWLDRPCFGVGMVNSPRWCVQYFTSPWTNCNHFLLRLFSRRCFSLFPPVTTAPEFNSGWSSPSTTSGARFPSICAGSSFCAQS